MSYIFQPFRYQLETAIRKHGATLKGRVLDVGAGSYDRYSGFLGASEYIRLNREAGPHTDLVGEAEYIPADNASYDGILCTQVLGDVYDVRAAIKEFSRILTTKGKVLVTESFMDPLHDEPHDFWRFTSHSLVKLFEEEGFVVLTLERVGGYYSVRAQMRARYYIEKFNLYTAWYGRLFGVWIKTMGRFAMWRDSRDTSEVNKKFTNGWLILAEKK